MYQFFVDPSQILDKEALITGKDVNHIKHVLRMKPGERVALRTGCDNHKYLCRIETLDEEEIRCKICETEDSSAELPSKVYLFQGLPKGDKMELIIQKAVELGVYEIIPVACKRAVVKLDEKKERSKLARWQGISEAAAKQSKRELIPKIKGVMSFREAVSYSRCAKVRVIPYECWEGMNRTREILGGLKPSEDAAVFIGPEGGFAEEEIETAVQEGILPITLGKRILRTETAGITVLSIIMYHLEQ
ncbi:MAG: 16S rRNA (uracil(1498)-N(3))-methyltransferase [Lachnospiraceae bacterium]|nr:16S rRNA (uracil(1498)-N(3))-methyltransferase [Lachnospiraceae bacterium]